MSTLALLRIERKLDLLLHSMKGMDPVLAELLSSGEGSLRLYDGDLCPVCDDVVHIASDFASEAYVRSCGCVPPVPIVAGISKLLEPPEKKLSKSVHLSPHEDNHAEEATEGDG